MSEVERFMAIVENPIFAYDDVRRLCVLESDHERVVAELKAEVVGLKEAMHNAASCLSMEIRQRMLLEKHLAKQAKVIDRLSAALEAVRSQMCWERDRDQLTMGMTSLHDDVTKALEEKAMEKMWQNSTN